MLSQFFYRKLQLVMNKVIFSKAENKTDFFEDPTTTTVFFSSQLSDGSNNAALLGCENLGAKIWDD